MPTRAKMPRPRNHGTARNRGKGRAHGRPHYLPLVDYFVGVTSPSCQPTRVMPKGLRGDKLGGAPPPFIVIDR